MQTRRDWLRSSIGIGGLMLAPSGLLSAQQKADFQPRSLEPIIRLSSNENPYGPSKKVQERIKQSFVHGCRYPYAYSDDLAETWRCSRINYYYGWFNGRTSYYRLNFCLKWRRNNFRTAHFFSHDGLC